MDLNEIHQLALEWWYNGLRHAAGELLEEAFAACSGVAEKERVVEAYLAAIDEVAALEAVISFCRG